MYMERARYFIVSILDLEYFFFLHETPMKPTQQGEDPNKKKKEKSFFDKFHTLYQVVPSGTSLT